MIFANLTLHNLAEFAAQSYSNPQCVTKAEFQDDFKRFKFVKRLCRRYLTAQKAQTTVAFGSERLLLNHLILLANVFGVAPTVRILFVKCESDKMWRVLKPFLWHLKYLPRTVYGINGKNVETDRIPLDEPLLRKIRDICRSNSSAHG
jgi:hypothetical protein